MKRMASGGGEGGWEGQKARRLREGWLDPHSFSEFDDGSRLVGQRVFVAGYGEGIVRAFRKQISISGASPHEIEFSGVGLREVKLRRKGNSETAWLLGPHIYASLGEVWGEDDEDEVLPEPAAAAASEVASAPELEPGTAAEDSSEMAGSQSEGSPEPEPEPWTAAEDQYSFQRHAQEAWDPVTISEGNTDGVWVDGASLDNTPRHMLIGATIMVELPLHLQRELYRFEGEARDESSPRASPSAKGLVVNFTKKRLHDSVHSVDFTLKGMKKHPLGKQDLVLQCAGHTGTGCRFLLLRSSWEGLLKDKAHAGGREQRLFVVYENQRSQLSLGSTEVFAKLGMGAGRPPCKDDFSPEHLIGHLDRPHWSSVDGKPLSDPQGLDPPKPPPGFCWDEGGWAIRRSWEYANGWNDVWTSEISGNSTVRRKRYERMLIREDPVAVVVENHRRVRTATVDKWSVAALDRSDPPAWCSLDAAAGPAKAYVLPNRDYQWDGEWESVIPGARAVDESGWSYAKNFGGPWGAKCDQSEVRQRSWRRKMKPITRALGVDFVGETADLLVRVHRAENLPSSSPSSCNTYAVICLGPAMKCTTPVVLGTASPTWNQLMRFSVPVQVSQLLAEGLDTLHCRVLESRMGTDEVLGELRINLVELLASEGVVQKPQAPTLARTSTGGASQKTRQKVHLSHTAYQEHSGCESDSADISTMQLPAMFLEETWYHLHPHTSHASTESWNQGILQVGIGLQRPRSSKPFECTQLESCEDLRRLCNDISSDHSKEARARMQYEFQLYNERYAMPWVVRPHWFENRTRWDCEQEHAMLRWVALIKQADNEGRSIHDEVERPGRTIVAAESATTQLPMATIGSVYVPAVALHPDVLSLVRQGMPGEDVWRRNLHIDEEEQLPSRVLQTLRSKMWYILTGGRDLNRSSAEGFLELSKEGVDELKLAAEKTGAQLPFNASSEDGTALVRGYVAMSICDDIEKWLGLGEKRGGFRAGEAALQQIKKDIPRTEASITPAESAALFRILLTFARRYPAVGYCQGMNNIALAVLRTTGMQNEAQGFWTFAGLCDRVCRGYYSESMTGVQVDAQVIERLTKEQHAEKSPKVNVIDHMASLGYPVVIKVTQWLVNLFVGAVPMPMLQALWDWVVVDGTCALICFATTLICHLSEEILKCTDFQQCSEVLQSDTVPYSTNACIECARVGPRLVRQGQALYDRVGVERFQTMRHEAIDDIVGRNKERTRNMMVRKLTGATAISKETVERLHEAFDLARKTSPDLRTTMVAGHQTPWEERVIDYKAFVLMMKIEMPELAKNDEMLQNLFNAFDDDRSGFVDEQEFIVGLSTLISDDSDNTDEKLRMCFSTADSSNNGRVCVEELQKLLESCYKLAQTRKSTSDGSTGLELSRQLSVQVQMEVTQLFSSIDDERTLSEGLTFEQFKAFVHTKPVILACFAAPTPTPEPEHSMDVVAEAEPQPEPHPEPQPEPHSEPQPEPHSEPQPQPAEARTGGLRLSAPGSE